MERVTVRIPDEQLEALEELVEEEGYPSKSEVVREAMRDLFDEKDVESGTEARNRRTR